MGHNRQQPHQASIRRRPSWARRLRAGQHLLKTYGVRLRVSLLQRNKGRPALLSGVATWVRQAARWIVHEPSTSRARKPNAWMLCERPKDWPGLIEPRRSRRTKCPCGFLLRVHVRRSGGDHNSRKVSRDSRPPTCKSEAACGSDRLRSYVRSVDGGAHDRLPRWVPRQSSKQSAMSSTAGSHGVSRVWDRSITPSALSPSKLRPQREATVAFTPNSLCFGHHHRFR